MKIKLILGILLLLLSCFTIDLNGVELDYKSRLKAVLLDLNDQRNVSDDKIESLIPTSEKEYIIFYSFTFPEQGTRLNNGFNKYVDYIGKKAHNNIGNFFKKYLELSQFVDGEFAEGYFEDVDFIITSNRECFCKIYPNLSVKKVARLLEQYNDNCR